MPETPEIAPEDIRRIRRHLDETQAQFARRLGVDQVTVARWETGRRRCSGTYAAAILRLDPERRRKPSAAEKAPGLRDDATLSAVGNFVRAFFEGSTARAVTALLSREKLSKDDLDTLAKLIEQKRREDKS
jgi:transcriptional regulator with XRE-family HTH domain